MMSYFYNAMLQDPLVGVSRSSSSIWDGARLDWRTWKRVVFRTGRKFW